jgi:hypothetical protein
MSQIIYGLAKSLAIPSGEEGGNFQIQMMFTCLRYTYRREGGSRRPVYAPHIVALPVSGQVARAGGGGLRSLLLLCTPCVVSPD